MLLDSKLDLNEGNKSWRL